MRNKHVMWVVVTILCLISLGWLLALGGSLLCSQLALAEYFRATTVEMMPFPQDCVAVQEQPSPRFMQIIKSQEAAYNLTLQKVVFCKMQRQITSSRSTLFEQAFDNATRSRWLPAYVGCCTYQFRRHFTVLVEENSEEGTFVSMAALIQRRSDYLRMLKLHCDPKLKYWQ